MIESRWDVVVVGAGPAGLAAACMAAEAGRRVVVLDENPQPGGQIWRGEDHHWIRRFSASGSTFRGACTVVDQPEPGVLHVVGRNISYHLRFKRLVIATGARERFMPFPGWTLPGVVGAGGLQALVKSGWPLAGKRVVVAGAGPLLLQAAAFFRSRGARLTCLAEQTPLRRGLSFALRSGKRLQAIALLGRLCDVPYRWSCWPVRASGQERVESVTLRQGDRMWTEPCDYLACSFGLVPNTELAQLVGCELVDGAVRVDEQQETTVSGVYCAGEPTGIGGVDLALIQGQIAGCSAAGSLQRASAFFEQRARWIEFRARLQAAFALRQELRQLPDPETVVCRCEDVPLKEIRPHSCWRSAKLQTRCGMGPCQGRICGPIVEFLFGWKVDSVRPPLTPVRLEQLVNRGSAATADRHDSHPG
ncbi:MAG: NAD(P)/FAD-dependent oxidoreductase [Bryobacteraceae bacterium]|nr:NAD(P)/FAD-dependent oxidoreductase [Bryobacteraceae bacterium]MDW8380352.1 FAD/NAD(P)-binding oxidoreductase [Bryobacterales bacterium]